MALIIPPPPTSADQNSRVWTDWYVKLSTVLSSTAGVAWSLVDKAGSKISDLANHAHSQLSAINGAGDYHLTATAAAAAELNGSTLTYLAITSSLNPTTTDIQTGRFAVWRNTALGEIRIWMNDAGTLKKSAVFT